MSQRLDSGFPQSRNTHDGLMGDSKSALMWVNGVGVSCDGLVTCAGCFLASYPEMLGWSPAPPQAWFRTNNGWMDELSKPTYLSLCIVYDIHDIMTMCSVSTRKYLNPSGYHQDLRLSSWMHIPFTSTEVCYVPFTFTGDRINMSARTVFLSKWSPNSCRKSNVSVPGWQLEVVFCASSCSRVNHTASTRGRRQPDTCCWPTKCPSQQQSSLQL